MINKVKRKITRNKQAIYKRVVFHALQDDKYRLNEDETSDLGLVLGSTDSKILKKRMDVAIEAYKKGKIKKLLFTGGISYKPKIFDLRVYTAEAIRMQEYAIARGVPKEDIILETKARNTIENIENSIEIIENENLDIHSITIISSDFHLTRTMLLFKRLGKDKRFKLSLIESKDERTKYVKKEAKFLRDIYYGKDKGLNKVKEK